MPCAEITIHCDRCGLLPVHLDLAGPVEGRNLELMREFIEKQHEDLHRVRTEARRSSVRSGA